jgi:type IV secretory pathway TraG/TraD family ATPase VirD4
LNEKTALLISIHYGGYTASMNITSHKNDKITPIAITNWRDIRKLFGIKEKNRRGHMYIVGKTGTGKSSLLAQMAISDIKQGNGIAVIDPHGDLAETLLSHIPENRIQDVIYFNPSDVEFPIAFNPLAHVSPDSHHLVVSGLISVFRKIYAEFWGPRLEHILRYACFTLLEYPGSTLLDIPKLLTDDPFRMHVLSYVTRDAVKSFWRKEFDSYSKWLRSEATAPILNKMSQFLVNLPIRNIVGQAKNTFRFREIMDQGKILIVNLSKGKIGEDNSTLLGSMITTMIFLAAMNRANVGEEQRRPFYFYVDEFHNFMTLSFANILSEARKYGLNLVLAHQYVRQLQEQVRDAVFGNVGTFISFRVGIDDAKYLSQEFFPPFEERDLINLPNYHIYIKLMIDGVTSAPFSAMTLPLLESLNSVRDKIITYSREQYTRPYHIVEQELQIKSYPFINSNNKNQNRLFS